MRYRNKFLHENQKIYDFIETAVAENQGFLSGEAEEYLADGLLTSLGIMSGGTITFTIDNLYWTDNQKKRIYGVWIMPVACRVGGIWDTRFKVVGNYQLDGGGSGRTDMFRKENRI